MTTNAKVKQLAVALATIGNAGEKVEALAAQLFRTIKSAGVRDEATFSDAVVAAYELNGWNTRQGRPSIEKRSKVPATVRTYVWELRSALKAGIPVWEFKSLYELRLARAKAKAKAAKAAAKESGDSALPELPELEGVRVSHADEPNGALFHDLIVLYAHTSESKRTLLGRHLKRLLAQYEVAAPKRATG